MREAIQGFLTEFEKHDSHGKWWKLVIVEELEEGQKGRPVILIVEPSGNSETLFSLLKDILDKRSSQLFEELEDGAGKLSEFTRVGFVEIVLNEIKRVIV